MAATFAGEETSDRASVTERKPDIQLAGLAIWTLGWQFPDADDYWDGNWLNVIARAEAPGARVEVQGPFLRTDEVKGFLEQLAVVHRDLKGTAKLDCMEPELKAEVACDALGHVTVEVRLTPDDLAQSHQFTFRVDQTYLAYAMRGCRDVLQRFPVRNKDM